MPIRPMDGILVESAILLPNLILRIRLEGTTVY